MINYFHYVSALSYLILTLIFPSKALAGPFGFDIKTLRNPANVYRYCKKDGQYYINCNNAPNPHSEINNYLIKFVKNIGICFISATSSNMSYNALKNQVDSFARQVSKKYGRWDIKEDTISPNSIWSSKQDWARSIGYGDRDYGYIWIFDNPINGIRLISVHPIVQSEDRLSWATIAYATPSYYDKCNNVDIDSL